MAERLGSGLQIRLQRFNSASHLQQKPRFYWGFHFLGFRWLFRRSLENPCFPLFPPRRNPPAATKNAAPLSDKKCRTNTADRLKAMKNRVSQWAAGGGCAPGRFCDILYRLVPTRRTVNKVAAYHTSGAERGGCFGFQHAKQRGKLR